MSSPDTGAAPLKPLEGKNPMGLAFIVAITVIPTAVMYGAHTTVLPSAEATLQALAPKGLTAKASFGLGFVLLGMLHAWLAACVNWARSAFDVPWPNAYAPSGHKYRHEFNCYQRASAHLIESTPTLLGTFVLATTLYPALSLVFFLFFLASRVFFSIGYQSGNVAAKDMGAFGYPLGKLPLSGLAHLAVILAVLNGQDW